jgi:5-methylcytosine-specific restriction endonuclease McrA
MCEAKGGVTAAQVLDHRIPLAKGGADDETNFQSLCKLCHDRKSNDDRGFRNRPTVGLDGWPVNDE